MSKKTKEYLRSSLITFLTGFAIVILPAIENLDLNNLEAGALAGILLTATRMGIKAVIEYFISIKKQS